MCEAVSNGGGCKRDFFLLGHVKFLSVLLLPGVDGLSACQL